MGDAESIPNSTLGGRQVDGSLGVLDRFSRPAQLLRRADREIPRQKVEGDKILRVQFDGFALVFVGLAIDRKSFPILTDAEVEVGQPYLTLSQVPVEGGFIGGFI